MSQFLSELVEKLADPHHGDGTGLWELTEDFQYYSTLLRHTVVVPRGFTHDHASVPRVPLLYANFGNRYHRQGVVHDYLCREGYIKRSKADRVFLEAMRVQNADEVAALQMAGEGADAVADRKGALEGRAQAMYAAVVIYSKLRG